MEKKESAVRRNDHQVDQDDLALTKSAAWAWYNRGFASDGRLIPQFQLRRSVFHPKPSRYKREAAAVMRKEVFMFQPIKNSSSEPPSPLLPSAADDDADCGGFLLDEYERESISRQLSSGSEAGRRQIQEVKLKRKCQKARWFWSGYGMSSCRSSVNDVVESFRLERSPQKSKTKTRSMRLRQQ